MVARWFAFLLTLISLAGCTADEDWAVGPASFSDYDSLKAAYTLWEMRDGVAEIPVCWSPPAFAPNRYPDARFTNGSTSLDAKRRWIREIAESEYAARTPLRFVGWAECAAVDASRYVQIVPIDSLGKHCGRMGRSCAESSGAAARGRRVFINVSEGDEVLYSARQIRAMLRENGEPQHPMASTEYGLPSFGLCAELDFLYENLDRLDTREVLERAHRLFQVCVQRLALHELGHVAGFEHEQQRTDGGEARDACVAWMKERQLDGTEDYPYANWPKRPFDAESIMSYCRRDPTPTLTDLDVARTKLMYPSP